MTPALEAMIHLWAAQPKAFLAAKWIVATVDYDKAIPRSRK